MSDVIERLNAALEGRYEIQRELGEGGMATVYLAEDLKHKRKVAVKVLRPELAAVVGGERFLAEIETTANLQHPHILPLFDSGEADGFLFYVMPYVEGESLRDRIEEEHQLPVEEAVKIAEKIGAALQYAHEQGVVHRDIKPANILVSRGEPLVADFGIALALSEAGSGRITETGLSLGTPHYMSPEQAAGERTLDKRSDVYALACVLYEMLTGQPPYGGPTAQAVLGSILTGDAMPPRVHRKAIPVHVEHAILKALEKLPADRFETAGGFVLALNDPTFRWREDEGAAVWGLPGARPWKVATGVLAGVAAILAAGLLTATLTGPADPATERQRIELVDFSPLPANWLVQTALEPRGDGIVFSDTTGSGGSNWILWFKPGGQADPIPLPNTGEVTFPVFSPDGRWLAFFTPEAELRKQPLQGGTSVLLADSAGGSGDRSALAWLEGGVVLFEGPGNSLYRISEDGGAAEVVATLEELDGTPVRATGLLGGGGALLVTCSGPSGGCPPGGPQLWLVDLEADTLGLLRDDVVGAWHLEGDRVVYADPRGAVFVARFDRDGLSLGTPTPLFDGVLSGGLTAGMQLDVDGTLLYLRGSGVSQGNSDQMVWVDRRGQATPVDEDWRGNFESMALSPDGSLLAVTDESDGRSIWVKELPDGPLTRLTPNGAQNRRPVWLPDGRSLAYQAGGQSDSLFVFDVRRADASTEARRFLQLPDTQVHQIDISRDGRYVVYRVNAVPDGDLRYMEIQGDDTVHHDLLVREGTNEVAPVLSPDARWVAYASDVSGTQEVYVRPFPDAMSARVKVSDGGASMPRWSLDGSELFYLDLDTGNMVVAAVETDPTLRIASREQLFLWITQFGNSITDHRYDVAPEGRIVTYTFRPVQESGNAPDLILVDNWFTELREILEDKP